jgi:hypothetical protein
MGARRRRLGQRQGRSAALSGAVALVAWLLGSGTHHAWGGEGYALTGLGGSRDGLHGYGGLIYAPHGSLSETGLLSRAWAKSFEFTYRRDLPDSPGTRINAFGYGFQVDAGWQIAGPWGRAGLFPGIAWRAHELKPPDPGSRLNKARFGLSVSADGEWRFSDRFGIMANASYLTEFDDYWAQARPYLHLGDGWKIGLDVAGYGGPDYARVRAGAFTSGYELPLKAFGRLFVGAEAGVQSDIDTRRLSPFAGMNIGLLF